MPLGKDRIITTRAIRGFLMQSFITQRRTSVFQQFCETRSSSVLGQPDLAGMIGTVPQVTEIINDAPPAIATFTEYQLQWYNKTFRSLVEIQESLIRGDQTGQTRTLLGSMGARLANFWDLYFFTRLQNGTDTTQMPVYNQPGAAATALFSATHALGGSSGNQSNIVTGSTTTAYVNANNTADVALKIQNDFATAKARMSSYVDDHGQPFHGTILKAESLVIVCGPLMEERMRTAFKAKLINQTDNTYYDAVREIVVSNYLPITGAGAATWYLVRIDNVNKPFIYSRFQTKTDAEMQDRLGVEQFSNAGPEFANITMEDMRNMSTMEIWTNIGRRGANAEMDTIVNHRFFIGASIYGEIIPGEWRNIIQVSNTAS